MSGGYRLRRQALRDLYPGRKFGMVENLTMKPRLFGWLVAFGLLADVNGFGATARDLLASPAQSIRDVGAAILRGAFVPPLRTNWDGLVAGLKLGMKQADVESAIQQPNTSGAVIGNAGRTQSRTYRLDDLWVLNCTFTNATPGKLDGGLAQLHLEEQMNNVWVDPPENLTGPWVTYWVNGQRYNERYYEYGKLVGTDTDFFPDGSKAEVSSYHDGVLDGEESGYFNSGNIKFKGQYRNGSQVGRWVWYNEDGKVQSEKDFGK